MTSCLAQVLNHLVFWGWVGNSGFRGFRDSGFRIKTPVRLHLLTPLAAFRSWETATVRWHSARTATSTLVVLETVIG